MKKEWRCKVCGGTSFTEVITGGSQSSTFDENGNCIEHFDQDLEFGGVYCENCDNTGDYIEDIAEYRTEEED